MANPDDFSSSSTPPSHDPGTFESTGKLTSKTIVYVVLLSLVPIVVSAVMTALTAFSLRSIPFDPEFTELIMKEWAHLARPEREMLYYRMFVGMTVGLQVLSFWKFRKFLIRLRLRTPDASPGSEKADQLRRFALRRKADGVAPADFAGVLRDSTDVSPWRFMSSVKQNTSIPGFLREPSKEAANIAHALSPKAIFLFSIDLCVIILIVLFIFVPHPGNVVSQIQNKDLFHHFDTFVASPAWAFVKGNVPAVDNASQYGFGMPIVIGLIAKFLGPFSYESMILTLSVMAVVYFILAYVFLRAWLRNLTLALLGLILMLKFQMFNNGSNDPVIWRYPSVTVVRFFFDVTFFLSVWGHLWTGRFRYLVVAAVASGLGLFFITDTGIYLAGAYYVYLMAGFALKDRAETLWSHPTLGQTAVLLLLPVATAFGLFAAFAGKSVVTGTFWENLMEFSELFLAGWGAMPIGSFIDERKYLNFAMGVVMVAGYLLTAGAAFMLLKLKAVSREKVLMVVLSLYGLGTFHYYIARSSPDNIPVVSIPFLMVLCGWLKVFSEQFPKKYSVALAVFLLALATGGLLTTRGYMTYPNIFNTALKSAPADAQGRSLEVISESDVQLIRDHSQPQEKVCLISSLETAILMRADRRPFLYYLPFIFSRTFVIRDFGGDAIFTTSRLHRVLGDLERQKPRYVFIEKKYLGGLPGIYYRRFETLSILVKYFAEHYEYADAGEYLVALRRRPNT